MGNRYTHQFNGSFKPRMNQIEGFVSIGTGGLLNYPDAYPIFPVATGATGGVTASVQTGPPRFMLPGQPTAGVPTGWLGGFSGCVGLIGAGVNSVVRTSTGTYRIELQDDWVAMDSFQVQPLLGATGCTGLAEKVITHTVGLGNSLTTGGATGAFFPSANNPKNCIWVQFDNSAGLPADVPAGGGFYLDIRLRDSLAGVR